MTFAEATEFLTKQLSIEKETVTFRWLSRKLSVHVNVAKNELASFYASSRSTDVSVHATFLLTGEVAPVKSFGSYRNSDEYEMDVEDNTQESILTRKIVLVGEDDLEAAKAQFTQQPSVHIYSLSPAAIRDAALLAPMADRVRPDDVSKGKSYNQVIGIVVGPGVKIGRANKLDTSKASKANTSASSSKLQQQTAGKKTAENPKSSEKDKVLENPKQGEKKTGTLDWSKAKPKEEKEKAVVATKSMKEVVKKEKEEVSERDDTKAKKQPMEAKSNTKHVVESEKRKRGTKRPSAVMSLSDSEDDNPSPMTKPRVSASPLPSRPSSPANGIKIKKGVLLSDDEEERPQKVKSKAVIRQKGKGRVSVAQQEEEDEDEVGPSTRAIMDLDSQVTRHPASDHEDAAEMLSDDEPIPTRPKAKRKPKKVIPVGRNGLPKNRVIKSRKSKNAKGYTITEDYSSYESASESEQVRAPADNGKKPKKSRQKQVDDSSTTKPKGNTNSHGNRTSEHNHLARITGKSQPTEGKAEMKKPMFESGEEGSTLKPVGKASNGGKNGGKQNLMSYFTKK